MTFKQFLRWHATHPTAVGDLARDLAQDRYEGRWTPTAILGHITGARPARCIHAETPLDYPHSACDDAVTALQDAARQWKEGRMT